MVNDFCVCLWFNWFQYQLLVSIISIRIMASFSSVQLLGIVLYQRPHKSIELIKATAVGPRLVYAIFTLCTTHGSKYFLNHRKLTSRFLLF